MKVKYWLGNITASSVIRLVWQFKLIKSAQAGNDVAVFQIPKNRKGQTNEKLIAEIEALIQRQ